MKQFVLSLMIFWGATPLWADARHTVLVDVLKLAELSQILHNEGQDYATLLERDFLGGKGGAGWQQHVTQIYATDRLLEGMRAGLETTLNGDDLEKTITFFASPLGQEILNLENTARVAMANDDVEASAREAYETLKTKPDGRFMQLSQMIKAGDLVNRNVSSALNSNYQFLRAMVDGDVYEMTEEEILNQVVTDQEEIEADTKAWLGAFMVMAYSPLSTSELAAYVTFSQSKAGTALNTGFFAGFDPLYNDISYGLGRAVALNMTAQEL